MSQQLVAPFRVACRVQTLLDVTLGADVHRRLTTRPRRQTREAGESQALTGNEKHCSAAPRQRHTAAQPHVSDTAWHSNSQRRVCGLTAITK